MRRLLGKGRILLALGLFNVGRVALYRLGIALRLNPVVWLHVAVPAGPYFNHPNTKAELPPPSRWRESGSIFGWYPFAIQMEAPPVWNRNVFTGAILSNKNTPWWRIPDFGSAGDIKATWELSRFDWAIAFAQRAATGEKEALESLNQWLDDWLRENPPYNGANWKCGQEASIRVMHLAICALILDQHERPTQALTGMVSAHLQRIAPTISYAVAQDNNHGTSEAAALYIGGTWLNRLSPGRKHRRWGNLGRRWLENRVARLVEKDGSFSQYSVNYHRVLIDTLSIVEVWRRALELPPFSSEFQKRAATSVRWLKAFVQEENGDAPNIGANDGARLLPLSDTDYRDYRPSVQLGSVLFIGKRAYPGEGEWNAPLDWLGLDLPQNTLSAATTQLYPDGGYAVLCRANAKVYLRYPRFRFRPSQSDALHLDLWLLGENILRDGGSYSYHTDNTLMDYFFGSESHNTVRFDDRDQMPRIGRFLFGDWLNVANGPILHETEKSTRCSVEYRDGKGAEHRRDLVLKSHSLSVKDHVNGFGEKAVLRWRLSPDSEWKLTGCTVTNGRQVMSVSANVPFVRAEIIEGLESRYYHQKTILPVFEIELKEPGTFTTEVRWN